MNSRPWLFFTLGSAAGCALTLLLAPHAEAASTASAPATVEVDEGPTHYTCTAASAEVLDASSSSPRLIVTATCPNGTQLTVVATPTRLPGSARVTALRFADVASGEEWKASDAKLDVSQFGPVGNELRGSVDGTMTARLNQNPVHVHATFRAPRMADRSSP